MELSTLLLFIPACFALNLAPGPNNLLSINNAAYYGFARSCAGGLGRLLAFVIMIVLASFGLAVVLHYGKPQLMNSNLIQIRRITLLPN